MHTKDLALRDATKRRIAVFAQTAAINSAENLDIFTSLSQKFSLVN